MNRLTARSILTALLLCWSFAFLWILQKDRYVYFIRPDFRWLIVFSLLLCALLSFALIIPGGRVRRTSTLELFVRTAVLLVPLIYMRASEGKTLGIRDLALRSVEIPAKSGFVPIKQDANLPLAARTGVPISSLIGIIRRSWLDGIEKVTGTGGSIQKLPIIKIKNELLNVYNKPVETIGMVYKDPRLPADCFIAFQFHIVCCAADAIPVGCLVHWPNRDSLINDRWCKISGVVSKVEYGGNPVVIVKASKVTVIDSPRNPYSY